MDRFFWDIVYFWEAVISVFYSFCCYYYRVSCTL